MINMKLLVAICAIILVVRANIIEEEWKKFQIRHRKAYSNPAKENKRYTIFANNFKNIAEHNKKFENGEETYFMAVNEYSDLTWEEFKEHFGIKPMEPPELHNVTLTKIVGNSPASFDWRDRGGITRVKDQGNCGSCWAFSTIGSLESRYFIVHDQTKIELSEQQLVDCSKGYGTNGCQGGWMPNAFDYIRDNDINREGDYPYVAQEQNCKANGAHNVNIKLRNYYQSSQGDEMALQDAVYEHGAMAAALHVTENFQFYKDGILTDYTCNGNTFNHAILITGYGRENNQDYWNIKNSWGIGWGKDGYMKFRRKDGNRCGIAQYAFSPNIEK